MKNIKRKETINRSKEMDEEKKRDRKLMKKANELKNQIKMELIPKDTKYIMNGNN